MRSNKEIDHFRPADRLKIVWYPSRHFTNVDVPAPFSPGRPCTLPGIDLQRNVRQGTEAAEMLADPHGLEADGVGPDNGLIHGSPARNVLLSLTAPNTPPCIFIMCSAAA